MSNIPQILDKACNDIDALIEGGREVSETIRSLQSSSNTLATQVHKNAISATQNDVKLKERLFALIKKLEHTPDFTAALSGRQQEELQKALKKIRDNVSKWVSKVEKADSGPL